MKKISFSANVDEYLSVNKYEVDEGHAHIGLASDLDTDLAETEFDKLILLCPAALYKRDEEGSKTFDYAGCLECGTCRIACGDTIVVRWEYPQPTRGIDYRYG